MPPHSLIRRSTIPRYNLFTLAHKEECRSLNKKSNSFRSGKLQLRKETTSVGRVEPHSRKCFGYDKHSSACVNCGLCTAAQNITFATQPRHNISHATMKHFGSFPHDEIVPEYVISQVSVRANQSEVTDIEDLFPKDAFAK